MSTSKVPASTATAGVEEQKPKVMAPTPEEIAEVFDMYQAVGARFIMEHPFYGQLLLQLKMTPTGEELPTAAVNYRDLFICAINKARNDKVLDWVRLSEVGRRTVLAHEILHLVFEHLSTPKSFHPQIANIAKDAVINRCLQQDSAFSMDELPVGCVYPNREQTGFTVGQGKDQQTFTFKDFPNMDWLPIYQEMMKQLEDKTKGDRAKLEELIKALGKANPMDGDTEGDGRSEDDPSLQQEANRFRISVQNAADNAVKQKGTVPGEVQRNLAAIHDGKISWREQLNRLVMTEVSRDDFSTRPNSRRGHLSGNRNRPLYMPHLWNETIGDIVLVLDTSGSMSDKELAAGLSEFKNMRNTKPFNVHFITCDAKVYDYKVVDKWEEPEWDNFPRTGGGGSSFVPASEFIDQKIAEGEVDPILVVFFTDGWINFVTEKPEYPVIVVSTQTKTDYLPDYATIIHMDEI